MELVVVILNLKNLVRGREAHVLVGRARNASGVRKLSNNLLYPVLTPMTVMLSVMMPLR